MVKAYPFIRSIASYFLSPNLLKRPGSGGTFSSEYCYSVWLRHLHYLLRGNFFNSVDEIKCIAEIGPGDSLGIGMSAIYTGANEYYAFDVIEHSNLNGNLKVNEDLFKFFKTKLNIPDGDKFKNTHPKLDDYSYPSILNLTDEYLEARIYSIKEALFKRESSVSINYIVPWLNTVKHDIQNLDLIFSQAVMEHVSDVQFAYKEMYRWLRKGGVISHEIDFNTHEMTKEWNGHWFISEGMWKFLSHGRKYPMNRLPLSAHIKMMEEVGFEIKFIKPFKKENPFVGQKPKVKDIEYTAEDLVTSCALIQAVKN